MKQISNYIYVDDLFDTIDIKQAIFASPYVDYPYFIIKNFFPKDVCKSLTKVVSNESEVKEKAKVKTEGYAHVAESYRKTNIGKLENYYENYYAQQFEKHRVAIEDYFSVAMSTSTQVQVLEYTKGYFYVKHADDSSELVSKAKETVGFKVVAPSRKLSSVLFVTGHEKHVKENEESFSGGELVFNYLYNDKGKNVKIEADAGDMIVFPSHPYFSHEVLPVTKGYRVTLVQWHDAV